MYKRKIYDKLLEWKKKSRQNGERSAILIEGARRVGKTTLVEEFGRHEYETCLMLDFTRISPDVKGSFQDLIDDLDRFFLYLQASTGVRLHEGRSLIVFDEVQAFPLARQSIKHLVADGRYDYIETGSLISLRANVKDILIPSEERAMQMYPFDFDEFLWALGNESLAEVIALQCNRAEPLPADLHRKAMRLFREYMLVGGMPQAVATYAKTHDLDLVEPVKRTILDLYRNDISKIPGANAARVRQAFNAIPAQLSRKTKRFEFSRVGSGLRAGDLEGAFDWLDDAFIVNRCYRCSEPTLDLASAADLSNYKCYLADTGLLTSLAFPEASIADGGVMAKVLSGKLSLNEGMLTENVVAQCLRASGHDLYYWAHYDAEQKRSYEVDFLLPRGYKTPPQAKVTPLEVKSGDRIQARSLEVFEETFREDRRLGMPIVLSKKPLKYVQDFGDKRTGSRDRHTLLPLYMAGCL